MTKKRKVSIGAAIIVLMVLISGLCYWKIVVKKEARQVQHDYMSELSTEDRELAKLYAVLYEKTDNDVAKMKQEKKDWKTVNEELEAEFFTIPEQTKYNMAQDGYDIDDLNKAEIMSQRTGKKAIDLAKAKGRAGEKKWSDVVKDNEIKSVEEQLGLTREQTEELKKKKYSEEDRIEIALLCINKKASYEDVMKEIEAGKSIKELKGETEDEREKE